MGSEVLNVKITEKLKEKIQSKINEKVATLLDAEQSDSNLFEYIMLLISNNRSKKHVATDLEAFFGQNAASFTDWLWDLIHKAAKDSKKRTRDNEAKDVVEPPKKASVEKKAGPSKAENAVKESPSNSSNNKEIKEQKQQAENEEKPESSKDVKDENKEKKIKKRKTLKKKGKDQKEESTTIRKIVNLKPQLQDKERAQARAARFTVTLNDKPNKDLLKDSKDIDQSDDAASSRIVRVSDTPSAPVAAAPASSEAPQSPSPGITTTMEAVISASPTLKSSSSVTSPPAPKQTRCVFWPACTKGEACPFHHPTQVCKFWPNCTFGDQCLNIHPACRYGLQCLNQDCTYSHPPGQRAAEAVLQTLAVRGRGRGSGRARAMLLRGVARGLTRGRGARGRARGVRGRGRGRGRGSLTLNPTSKKVNKILEPCRFDPNCTSITCEYTHPIRDAKEKAFLKQEAGNGQDNSNADAAQS